MLLAWIIYRGVNNLPSGHRLCPAFAVGKKGLKKGSGVFYLESGIRGRVGCIPWLSLALARPAGQRPFNGFCPAGCHPLKVIKRIDALYLPPRISEDELHAIGCWCVR